MNFSGLFVRGFIIGFSVAAPVGPVGVLCIQRSLAKGFRSGFFPWLGWLDGLGALGFDGGKPQELLDFEGIFAHAITRAVRNIAPSR